ncbi:MAG: flippase [Thermodesulfovibrionales bacterium]|nr:flippase [Thermodesulfovibrionales bacterium]
MIKETSYNSITKNSIYNLLGYLLPIISAILSIPFIIKGLGVERFGFLTLSWAIVGYFTLFDLGLSRSLTFHVSTALTKGKDEEIKTIVCTGIYVMFIFGLFGTILLYLMSKILVFEFFKTSLILQDEFDSAIKILSLIIPFVIISTALKGILEAYQQFLKINIIQTFIGISNFVSPLIVLYFSDSLIYIMIALVIIRLLALIMYLVFVKNEIPSLFKRFYFQPTYLKLLMSYGGWIFISSFVGPLMVYSDRFFIASLLSVHEVAYYTTPFEIITKLTIVSVAISGALFPFLTSSLIQDSKKAITIFDKALKYVYLITFPIMLLTIIFSDIALSLWIDKDFAQKSSKILQWLSIGVFLNCLAFMPLSFIHALKRPDVTAKIHLLELPLYILLLIWFINSFGLKGAAIAWTIRTGFDGLLLFYMTIKLKRETLSIVVKHCIIIIISLILTISFWLLLDFLYKQSPS